MSDRLSWLYVFICSAKVNCRQKQSMLMMIYSKFSIRFLQ